MCVYVWRASSSYSKQPQKALLRNYKSSWICRGLYTEASWASWLNLLQGSKWRIKPLSPRKSWANSPPKKTFKKIIGSPHKQNPCFYMFLFPFAFLLKKGPFPRPTVSLKTESALSASCIPGAAAQASRRATSIWCLISRRKVILSSEDIRRSH